MTRKNDRNSRRQPLYQKTEDALVQILKAMEPGTYLPSEPTLAKRLGVSRTTLREAMRTFEGRGLIVRRQGVGTYVTRAPQIIETGLDKLESIATLATRLGLEVEMVDLKIEQTDPTEEEIYRFKMDPGDQVVKISRVMSTDDRAVAHLVDILPEQVISQGDFDDDFRGSVLDWLLDRGDPILGHSRTDITAVSATASIARRLNIQRGDVLLCMEAWLYTIEGGTIDHTFSYFLPGTFRFHLVRRVGQ